MRDARSVLAEMIQDPASDELRLEYARVIAVKDPEWARFIEEGLQSLDHGGAVEVQNRIARNFSCCNGLRFFRGFVEEIAIDPYVFLTQGARLLASSPIRHVQFRPDREAVDSYRAVRLPSPIPELMTSPLLKRLRSISFESMGRRYWRFDGSDLGLVLGCPYLEDLIWLRIDGMDDRMHGPTWWRTAYANRTCRALLHFELVNLNSHPAEQEFEFDRGDAKVITTSPISPLGNALEAEHGYLPSLHRLESMHSPFIATLRHERGEAPRFPVGAPLTPEMAEQPDDAVYPHNWQ
ncbi:MAG: hypothetical protein H7269_07880 [Cellulomonas sp.]|nr:hypothetical protein [Cellulomonas sp.]